MNADGKRRLPTWMLGVAGADQVRKSEEKENEHARNTQDGKVSKRTSAKSKKAEIGRPEKKDSTEISDVNVSVLTRCRRKTQRQKTTAEDEDIDEGEVSEKVTVTKKQDRRGRKILQPKRPTKRPKKADSLGDFSSDEIETASPDEEDGIDDGEASENVIVTKKRERCGRQVLQPERCTKRPKKAENLGDASSDEIEAASPGEEDGDLTMEDLLSIAHEYVRTDERIEQQPSSSKEQEKGRPVPPTAVSVNKSTELPVAHEINRGSPLRKESISIENPTVNLVTEGTLNPSRRTGDSTQDMLDLFLGPLLKKPTGDDTKIKSVEEEAFECEFRKQRQKNIAEEVLPPLTKKKGSLKDKVAMLLDL